MEVFFGLFFFFISECFVSRCCFGLFGFILSAIKIPRYKTHWSRPSQLTAILVKPKDKYEYNLSDLHDFGFDIQLWLLFAVGLSSGFLFIRVHVLMVHKTLINTKYWTATIMRSKYYGMCVLRLYTMKWKCLRVNILYFITEYSYVLTRWSLSLKAIYSINVFTD
jgi:hypothetical protein